MRYEEVAGCLLRAARQAGLRTFAIHSTLETTELDRVFSVRCIPEDWPKDAWPVAEFSFEWDSALTSYTVLGTERLCSLYHPSTEPCPHSEDGGFPSIYLDVVFDLPPEWAQDVSPGTPLGRLGLRVKRLLKDAGVTGTAHPPVFLLEVEEKGVLRVTEWRQPVEWLLDYEQLEDNQELTRKLTEICQEVRQGLVRLREEMAEPERKEER